MLGRPYMISGRVLHAANSSDALSDSRRSISVFCRRIPKPSLHIGRRLPSKRTVSALGRWGMACVGRPTVDDHGSTSWKLISSDFHGDLYDRDVKVEFFSKIRDEKKFGSLEELRAAIADDQLKAKQILGLRI